jgi:hypothetical protein
VVAAAADGDLIVWHVMGDGRQRALQGRWPDICALTISPDGQAVISLSLDGRLAAWGLASGHLWHSEEGPAHWRAAVQSPMPQLGRSFPFDEEAVKRAVRAQQIKAEEQKSGWDALVRQVTRAVLRDIISGYTLDELYSLHEPEIEPRAEISAAMVAQMRGAIKRSGLQLLGGAVGNLLPSQDVVDEHIDHWRAHLKREIVILQAQTEAEEITRVKRAEAEAEHDMIERIAQVLDQLRDLDPEDLRRLIALRLLAAIEQSETEVARDLPESNSDADSARFSQRLSSET